MIVRNKFYHEKTIERLSRELLFDYYKVEISEIPLPIAVDKILELHLGLNVLWEDFNNSEILAGLIPSEKTVVINEAMLESFNKNKGWENFTKSHEIGHWMLHVDQSDIYTDLLPGFDRQYEVICRETTSNDWDETNVDRFASYFLMPREHVLERAKSIQCWADIAKLADQFCVSKTAMKVRLERLGLLYVDNEGRFHRSKQEYFGQGVLV